MMKFTIGITVHQPDEELYPSKYTVYLWIKIKGLKFSHILDTHDTKHIDHAINRAFKKMLELTNIPREKFVRNNHWAEWSYELEI